MGTGQNAQRAFVCSKSCTGSTPYTNEREKIPHSPKGYPNTLVKDALVGAKNGGNSEIKQENPIVTTAMYQAK